MGWHRLVHVIGRGGKESILCLGSEMDWFAALAMTVPKHEFAFPRRDTPELLKNLPPSKTEGAGKAGCALHPRSRVQFAQRKRTRAYRFSGEHPAFPAQWFYGLLRALPGERAFLPPSLRKYFREA